MNMRKQTKRWITKDGRKIRICDMEDSHLLNTIAMLQRNGEAQRIKHSVFYATCDKPTADGALDCFNREFDMVMESTFENYVPDIYENLIADAERRQLNIPIQKQRLDIECNLIERVIASK